MRISRREALATVAAVVLPSIGARAEEAQPLPLVTVTKTPTCGCCGGWVAHLREAGFPVRVVDVADVKPTKARLGVAEDLSSCHTAEVAFYVVEGHVPAHAIKRLLAEKPSATGLAVPGMPAASPGMGGEPEEYDVILFSPAGRQIYGRYRGAQAI